MYLITTKNIFKPAMLNRVERGLVVQHFMAEERQCLRPTLLTTNEGRLFKYTNLKI